GQEPLNKQDLVEVLRLLLDKKGVDSCRVIGYSMGGRLALCLGQVAAEQVKQLILVAPEGLRRNRWFGLATGSTLGKFFFKTVMHQPQKIIWIPRFLKRIGLMSRNRASFVERLILNRDRREKSYKVWMCFRKLKIGHREKLLKKMTFPVCFVFGK